ncbi:MAG: High-affinity branched-chain amino acid transport protein superfamily, ATP-binding [Frankiales bacterium]|jgi:branched-chain amino acid transport system ATP-binding protein|nr:High-affinity branched-chain amino acid transport protein superfamily, ATP-binding [Frankiales bacterium]
MQQQQVPPEGGAGSADRPGSTQLGTDSEPGSRRVETGSGGRASGGQRFEASGITVRFGGLTALNDVSLHVEQGEVLGVIGPNGAGKTTLFNVVCGFTKPNEGSLTWRGEPLVGLRPHKLAGLGIARTLQGVGLFAGLTVVENVMTGLHAHAKAGFLSALLALPKSDRDERVLKERAMAALDSVGAAGYAGRYPGSLPYPVQKRVALARALVLEPDLLLLDEPAGGVGHDDMDELGETIRHLSGRMAVMLVEHHMDLVMSVCDRITVLDFGKVIANGTPAEIRENPQVLAAYLGDEDDDSGLADADSSPQEA